RRQRSVGRADRVPRERVDAYAASDAERQSARRLAPGRLRLARSLGNDRGQLRADRQFVHRAPWRRVELPVHRYREWRRDVGHARYGRISLREVDREKARLTAKLTSCG